jgi:glucose dehydrogenase
MAGIERQMLRSLLFALAACAAAGCSAPDEPVAGVSGSATEPEATAAANAAAPGAELDGMVEWRHYGGNLAAHRYSPLDQIDASNVADLRVAWRWQSGNFGPRPEAKNEATPLMIGGVLYTTAGITRNVVAIDPETGETLWIWRPQEDPERFDRAPRKNSGRGLSYWTDGAGNDRLIGVTPGFQLFALDPASGRPVPGFGERGIVDMLPGVRGSETDHARIGNSSPPIIIDDVIIVGPAHAPGANPPSRQNAKGDVRAYDVRTGQELWSFHTIPEPGEAGYDTWLDGSAEYTGNAGVWPGSQPTSSAVSSTCRSRRRPTTGTGASGPATTSTATRSFASMRAPAGSSGITSSFITTSGTGIIRRRRSSWTSSSTARKFRPWRR